MCTFITIYIPSSPSQQQERSLKEGSSPSKRENSDQQSLLEFLTKTLTVHSNTTRNTSFNNNIRPLSTGTYICISILFLVLNNIVWIFYITYLRLMIVTKTLIVHNNNTRNNNFNKNIRPLLTGAYILLNEYAFQIHLYIKSVGLSCINSLHFWK